MSDKDKLKSLKLYLEIINQLFEKLEKLNDDEKEEILSGNVSVNINLKTKSVKKRSHNHLSDSNRLIEIEQYLRTLEDRQQGRDFINKRLASREELVRLARHLDLPVAKEDSIEKLKEKIIESTIGYRLRSRAIQEFDLK